MNPPSPALRRAYEEIVKLWKRSGVENHAEGHPGISGPAGNALTPWDESEAYANAIETTARTIRERLR